MEGQLLSLFIASLIPGVYISNATDKPTYFSLIVSSVPTINTSGIVSAVDQALELVNSDITILPGYYLQYNQVLDTQQCVSRGDPNPSSAITSNESVVAIVTVGCGCSLTTEKIASRSDIPVISSLSTSAALSDRSMYPNLFRTVPSDELLAPALATVMQYYGWRTLSILTEQESQFTELLQLLDTSLSTASISVENSVHFNTGNLSEAIDTIFEGDSRIIILNTNPKSALFYLCRTFLEGRYYPGYVWITPGWYQQGWWKADENYLHSLKCTSSDIEQQLNRSLVLLAHPNTRSVNITEPYNSSSYAMDAVMTLALALNETLQNPSLNLSLHTAIEAVMFSGATGIVKFDDQGNRLNPVVLLQQFRIDSSGSISLYCFARIDLMNATVMLQYINGETNSTVWPGMPGFPPVITVISVLKPSVYAYMVTLVSIGLILSIVCLMFNVIFHNRKVVKLTSPNLNYAITLGAVLLLIGNFLITGYLSRNKEQIAILCIIERAFLTIGYDLCFVVALVKTARVVYIFRKVSPTKKKVKDWHLLLLSAGIIMIEVMYVIPLLVLNYVKGDARLKSDYENPSFTNEHGYTIVHYIIACDRGSLTYIVFILLTIVYKVIIHVIGLVLTFLTRKVKIDSLNDSKYSNAIIYCSCFLLIMATIVNFTVPGINRLAVVWTSFIFIEVCMFLGLTFLPKMVLLYKDPQGKTIFNGDIPNSSLTTTGTNDTRDHLKASENSI